MFRTMILLATLPLLLAHPTAAQENGPNADPETPMETTDMTERMERGLEKLRKIDGEAGERVIESLADVSPDLARYTIEYPFGDIYERPGLSLRDREIATIAALTAMGNATPQLKVHIQAGLNVGLTEEEIKEVIIQMSVYAGFPSALNGMQAAKEVFATTE
ncbi:carboxymuconolactone decarboxylase family protein [Parvularcula sp. BGMRC 0090]|uniref:Carboxymuconolactone decarboxylase family protein n=2 Tax=Parvularcula maris TaxID=2965077 RepID=A0A9X2RIJ7_9PROT|nr:carboxymuconolactone decarboxylase family protein [Parvularcula maris]MCQ8186135.1 carboxymuconolactone decarboxylase family protein [Parvularcula maris]